MTSRIAIILAALALAGLLVTHHTRPISSGRTMPVDPDELMRMNPV